MVLRIGLCATFIKSFAAELCAHINTKVRHCAAQHLRCRWHEKSLDVCLGLAEATIELGRLRLLRRAETGYQNFEVADPQNSPFL